MNQQEDLFRFIIICSIILALYLVSTGPAHPCEVKLVCGNNDCEVVTACD